MSGEIIWTQPKLKNRGGKIHVSLTTTPYGRARFSTGLIWSDENIKNVRQNIEKFLFKFLQKNDGGNIRRLGECNRRLFIDEIGEHYIQQYCGHIKRQTLLKYKGHIKILKQLVYKDVRLLTQVDYNEIIKNINQATHLFLNRILNHAKDEGIPLNLRVAKKIMRAQDVGNDNKSVSPFSMVEIKNILQEASARIKSGIKPNEAREVRNYIAIAFFTGARTGEILALTKDDIDIQHNKLKINKAIEQASGLLITPKTNKAREIDLIDNATEAFLDQIKISNNKRGRLFNLCITKIRKEWGAILEACSFKYRPLYQTRHSYATLMLSNNEGVDWVSAQLGHSNIQTTFTHYFKYIPNNKKRGAFIKFNINGEV